MTRFSIEIPENLARVMRAHPGEAWGDVVLSVLDERAFSGAQEVAMRALWSDPADDDWDDA